MAHVCEGDYTILAELSHHCCWAGAGERLRLAEPHRRDTADVLRTEALLSLRAGGYALAVRYVEPADLDNPAWRDQWREVREVSREQGEAWCAMMGARHSCPIALEPLRRVRVNGVALPARLGKKAYAVLAYLVQRYPDEVLVAELEQHVPNVGDHGKSLRLLCKHYPPLAAVLLGPGDRWGERVGWSIRPASEVAAPPT